MIRFAWLSLLFVVFAHGIASAHSLGVDKATLKEIGEGKYELSSYVPPKLAPLIKTPVLPDGCSFEGNPRGERGNYEVRFLFVCEEPLSADDTIHLPWNREGALLTVLWPGQEGVTQFIQRDGKGMTVSLDQFQAGSGSFWKAGKRYTILGIEHILEGVDHLLFVLGLVLIVSSTWRLVKTITAFTVAHSITLGLATLGFVNVPSGPVDVVVALSIVFLGAEIVYAKQGRVHLSHRKPWLVAFGFGLLHGLGFAGALTKIGLPPTEIPLALLFFNVGVEVGQLFFVLTAIALMRSFVALEIRWPNWSLAAPAYVVGVLGAYWTIQRTAIMVGVI